MKRIAFASWVKDCGGTSKTARILGVNRQSVHQWLTGCHVPRADMVAKIIAASKNQLSFTDFYPARSK